MLLGSDAAWERCCLGAMLDGLPGCLGGCLSGLPSWSPPIRPLNWEQCWGAMLLGSDAGERCWGAMLGSDAGERWGAMLGSDPGEAMLGSDAGERCWMGSEVGWGAMLLGSDAAWERCWGCWGAMLGSDAGERPRGAMVGSDPGERWWGATLGKRCCLGAMLGSDAGWAPGLGGCLAPRVGPHLFGSDAGERCCFPYWLLRLAASQAMAKGKIPPAPPPPLQNILGTQANCWLSGSCPTAKLPPILESYKIMLGPRQIAAYQATAPLPNCPPIVESYKINVGTQANCWLSGSCPIAKHTASPIAKLPPNCRVLQNIVGTQANCWLSGNCPTAKLPPIVESHKIQLLGPMEIAGGEGNGWPPCDVIWWASSRCSSRQPLLAGQATALLPPGGSWVTSFGGLAAVARPPQPTALPPPDGSCVTSFGGLAAEG